MEQRIDSATRSYHYFTCPLCGSAWILQPVDYYVKHDGPVRYAKDCRPMAKRDFTIVFILYCVLCKQFYHIYVTNDYSQE